MPCSVEEKEKAGMVRLISGIYLGWGLGANDAANIFGTGVASGVVKYRTAVLLTAIFVLLGSYFEGSKGIETYGRLTTMDVNTAFIASLASSRGNVFEIPTRTISWGFNPDLAEELTITFLILFRFSFMDI